MNIEINSLRKHVGQSDEYLLVAVKNEQLLGEDKEKATVQLERQERYRNKTLHGRFFKATDDVGDGKTWEWLRISGIKNETEGLLMAAQEQAIRTKYIFISFFILFILSLFKTHEIHSANQYPINNISIK